MLHLQIEKQFIALSWRPYQFLWQFTSTTAASSLLPNIGDTQMPKFDLLHDVL